MTRADALRAARALLDGMAGTTDGEWTALPGEHVEVGYGNVYAGEECVCSAEWEDAAHIARSCPARLGPVLRALMEGEE